MALSPTDKVQLALQLDDQVKRELKPGQHVWLVAQEHADQRLSAEISALDFSAASGQSAIELTLTGKKPADFLQQDKLVTVEIELNRRADTLSLSMSAIRNVDSAEPWVMVSDNGRAQRRVVKLGMRAKSRVEVLEGLRENELVFPATGMDILEGKRIRLARS
jgi:HlyD family secretion protein